MSDGDVPKRFLRAYQKTLDWRVSNREEAARLWAQVIRIDMSLARE